MTSIPVEVNFPRPYYWLHLLNSITVLVNTYSQIALFDVSIKDCASSFIAIYIVIEHSGIKIEINFWFRWQMFYNGIHFTRHLLRHSCSLIVGTYLMFQKYLCCLMYERSFRCNSITYTEFLTIETKANNFSKERKEFSSL